MPIIKVIGNLPNKDTIFERQGFINIKNGVQIIWIAMETFFTYISLVATEHHLNYEVFLVKNFKQKKTNVRAMEWKLFPEEFNQYSLFPYFHSDLTTLVCNNIHQRFPTYLL